jgi:CubicO group peptidase (beta-lactamase class C family)
MLTRRTPSSQRVASTGILGFTDTLETSPDIEPHSLMLLRHGQVIAEGWWKPYTADRLQLLYSLSKSFTSTALGLAVAEGLVRLDDTVLSWFPELDGEVTDPRSRGMLVRHLAAMASGHREETVGRAMATDGADLVRGFLLTPPDQAPGSIFAYNQPCTYTLAAIVVRASGGSLTDYLRPRLLDPLGIAEVAWTHDGSGRDLGYSGLHATTDAVARLGQLYLQRGVWAGQQLLSEEWVEEATRPQVATSVQAPIDWQQGYGFQFWRSRHGYRGDGAFGQFCVVLPEQDVVLALTSATYDMQAILDAVWEHLLPAVDAVSPEADAALAERLGSLALPPAWGEPEPPHSSASRWSRFRADVTDGPLSSVAVTRTEAGWQAELSVKAASPLVVPLGCGDWTVVRTGPTQTPVPVAVSGGWSGAGTLQLDVIFVETPHRLQVTCQLEEAVALAQWVTTPLDDPALLELRAPR